VRYFVLADSSFTIGFLQGGNRRPHTSEPFPHRRCDDRRSWVRDRRTISCRHTPIFNPQACKSRLRKKEISFDEQPGRQSGCCKPGVDAGMPKKKILTGGNIPFGQGLLVKTWSSHAPQAKTNCSVMNRSTWLVTHVQCRPILPALGMIGRAILHATARTRVFYQHAPHGPARHQNTIWVQESLALRLQTDYIVDICLKRGAIEFFISTIATTSG